jgi:PAS domain S-box-containing protein
MAEEKPVSPGSESDETVLPAPAEPLAGRRREPPASQAGQSQLERLIATLEERQIESLPTPVAYLDLDFNIVITNRAFTRIFGQPKTDLQGHNYLALFPGVETGAIFNRVSATGQAEGLHDCPLILASQPERGVTYWDWTLAPVTSKSDQIEGFILFLTETTQRVRANDVLQRASQELEETVKQRTVALRELNLELAAEVQRRTIAEVELRSLSRRLVQMQEDERRRISQELHDEVGQNLTMLKMILDTEVRHPGAMSPEATRSASEQVSQIIAQVRNISMSLHPSMLEVLGLETALRALFDRLSAQTGLKVDFHAEIDNERLDQETRLCVYRIVQEALTNVLRYSGVMNASITLLGAGDNITLGIKDDGRGFNYAALTTGQSNGISGMRERVFTLGGTFSLEAGIGKGTCIDVDLPYCAVTG